MTCSRIRDNLALYVGDDLVSTSDVREMEAHLAECSACRAEAEALRRSLAALRASAVTEEMLPAADPHYWHEVESKLRERALGVDKLRLGRPGWRSVPAMLAQAALVLVVAGLFAWALSRQDVPQRATAPPTLAKAAVETRRPPVIVVLRRQTPYGNEVSPLPAGSDVLYSDFNHVVQPDEARRVRDQVMSASWTDDGGGF